MAASVSVRIPDSSENYSKPDVPQLLQENRRLKVNFYFLFIDKSVESNLKL